MKTLYVTPCSAEKKQGIWSPKELYKSDRVHLFIKYCEVNKSPWSILSAEYGLFFPDDQHRDYNVTFKSDTQGRCRVVRDECMLDPTQSLVHINKLVAAVQGQINTRKIEDVIFYAKAPKMAKCYFLVLHRAVDGCIQDHKKFEEIKDHIKNSEKIKHITQLK